MLEIKVRHLDIWFWCYLGDNRNYSGLHFSGTKERCSRLRDCLEDLRSERVGLCTIPLRKLSIQDEALINSHQAFQEFEKLVLRVDLSQSFPIVVDAEDFANLRFTVNIPGIELLSFVAQEVGSGGGDRCIQIVRDPTSRKRKHREMPFWYWPCYWQTSGS